jgi:two-component system, NarL family, sensor histidine kinase DegS
VKITRLFLKHNKNFLVEPDFWFIIFLLIVIGTLYYLLQIYRVPIFQTLPAAQDLVVFEYIHNLNGSLFIIPLLYAIFRFWWRGTLIIWVLITAIILPRITYFYPENFGRTFFNIFYLSIPLLVVGYIVLELTWREKERNQLEEREQERQNYLGQIFKAQEEERRRLAHEIHDDSIQRLTAIAINAKLLSNSQNLTDSKKGIESIRDLVIGVSQDLRRITLDLRPTVLDDLGLVPAIRWLIKGFKDDSGIEVQMEMVGIVPQLSKKFSINIFRIVQEALTNIRKHSKATKVNIALTFTENLIKVTITDNGVGFIKSKTNAELTAKGKLGLLGMQQRTQILKGTFIIHSDVGAGTILIFQFKPE